jgi:glucarate dehydratase
VGDVQRVLRSVRERFADRDAGGAGCRPSTCAPPSTSSRPSNLRCSTCWPAPRLAGGGLLGEGQQRDCGRDAGLPVLRGDRNKTDLPYASEANDPQARRLAAPAPRAAMTPESVCGWPKRRSALRLQRLQAEGRRARGEAEVEA